MFCPNCGTENDDAATTCKKCGFNLKGAAAPKFKGTMLMMNAGGAAPRPGAPAQPTPGAPPAGAPQMPPAGPGMPTGPRPQLKGTMLGVAPPSLGAQTPPPGAAPAPVPAPAHAAAPAGFGAPPPAAAPQGFPGGAVNPLGGTMVADQAGGFNPYGQPPGGGYGPPPQGGGFGAPPGPPGNFGAPPPAPAGFGAPPPPAGFGPPPGAPQGGGFPPPGGAGGYGQPPQQQFGQPPGGTPAPAFGQQPQGGYAAPSPGFGAPAAAPGYAPAGAVVPAGGRGAIGKTRNPVMVLLISMLCFVYALIEGVAMLKELQAFRGKQDINILLHMLLWPIFVWSLPAKVLEAKQMAGVPNAQVASPVLYFLLGLYFLPNDLNEVWQAAGGGQQR